MLEASVCIVGLHIYESLGFLSQEWYSLVFYVHFLYAVFGQKFCDSESVVDNCPQRPFSVHSHVSYSRTLPLCSMRPEIPDELEPRINAVYRLGGYATSSELVRDSVRRRLEILEDQWFRAGVRNGDGLIDMDRGVTIGTRYETTEPVRVARWSLDNRNTVTVGIPGNERRQLTKQLIEADREHSETRFVVLDALGHFSDFTTENDGVCVDYSLARTYIETRPLELSRV